MCNQICPLKKYFLHFMCFSVFCCFFLLFKPQFENSLSQDKKKFAKLLQWYNVSHIIQISVSLQYLKSSNLHLSPLCPCSAYLLFSLHPALCFISLSASLICNWLAVLSQSCEHPPRPVLSSIYESISL